MAANLSAKTQPMSHRVMDLVNLFNSLDAKLGTAEPPRRIIVKTGVSGRWVEAETKGKALPLQLHETFTSSPAQNGMKLLEYKPSSPGQTHLENKSSLRSFAEQPVKQSGSSTLYNSSSAREAISSPAVIVKASESALVSPSKATVSLPLAQFERLHLVPSSEPVSGSWVRRGNNQNIERQEEQGVQKTIGVHHSPQAGRRTPGMVRASCLQNNPVRLYSPSRSRQRSSKKGRLQNSPQISRRRYLQQDAIKSHSRTSPMAETRTKRPFVQQETREAYDRPAKRIKASDPWDSTETFGTGTIHHSPNSICVRSYSMRECSCLTDSGEETGNTVPRVRRIEWREECTSEGYTDERSSISTDDEHEASYIYSNHLPCETWLSGDHLSSNARRRLEAKQLSTADKEGKCNETQSTTTTMREGRASGFEQANSPSMIRGKFSFASKSARHRLQRRKRNKILRLHRRSHDRQPRRQEQELEHHLSTVGESGLVGPPPTLVNSAAIYENFEDFDSIAANGKDDRGTTPRRSSVGSLMDTSQLDQLNPSRAIAVAKQSGASDVFGAKLGEMQTYNKHDSKRRYIIKHVVPATHPETRGGGSSEAATIPLNSEDRGPSTHRGQLQSTKSRKMCMKLPSELTEPSLHVAEVETTLSDNDMLEQRNGCKEALDETVYDDRDLAGIVSEASTTRRVGRICQTLDAILGEHQEALSAITHNLARQLSKIDADIGRAGLRTGGQTGSQRHETDRRHAGALEEHPDSVMALIDRVEATATTLGGLAQHRDRPRRSDGDGADGGQRCTCKSFEL